MNASEKEGNWLANPGFEKTGPNDRKLNAWSCTEGVGLFRDDTYSGNYCLKMERTEEGREKFIACRQKGLPLKPGGLYRLQFMLKVDGRSKNMFAVALDLEGEEGPAWLKTFVDVEETGRWTPVEVLFRAQERFNPLKEAAIELRLYQWSPGQVIAGSQTALVDALRLEEMPEGERCRLLTGGPWFRVPGYPGVRYSDLELGLGSGITAKNELLEVLRGDSRLERVFSLEELNDAGHYAYSPKNRRLYLSEEAACGMVRIEFIPGLNEGGDGYLDLPPESLDVVGGPAADEQKRVPLEVVEPAGVGREQWPVTQGVPLPRGAARDTETIRILGPDGGELPAQIRATSYWEDDSIRWVLVDFQLDIKAHEELTLWLEYGPEVERREVEDPLTVEEDDQTIAVDTGVLRFTIARDAFHPLEGLQVEGEEMLSGTPVLSVTDARGREYAAHRTPPYCVTVEEQGPLRAAIAVRGWHVSEAGERFMTYTTRIHAYRNRGSVRIFHTVTNRHEENDTVEYTWEGGTLEFPQRGVADISMRLPLEDMEEGTWLMEDADERYRGDLAEGPVTHRQQSHDAGMLKKGGDTSTTGPLTGTVSVQHGEQNTVAAIYNYDRLFPKELRVDREGLSLGLAPFSTGDPHDLLQGTATTTEFWLAFVPGEEMDGLKLGTACTEPLVVSSPAWYCQSGGFLNEELLPVDPQRTGIYDEAVDGCVDVMAEPRALPEELSTCGLRDYGDTLLGGRKRWTNLEYDVDLGLYLHFARSGRREVFLYGQDASRHFLDSDMLWYSGEEMTHGHSLSHYVAHYGVQSPGGHSYTVGLVYYYLLTGDRRGLEGAHSIADCCHRLRYFECRLKNTLPVDHDFKAPVQLNSSISTHLLQHVNCRPYSCPARHTLTVYQMLGEPRYIQTTLEVAEVLIGTPPELLCRYGESMHYRWPRTLYTLQRMTGREDLAQFISEQANWALEVPYKEYGEYRCSQSYSGAPSSALNNSRMLFMTINGYLLDGDRRHLHWMMNMYDELSEYITNLSKSSIGGKLFGKIACNPARALPIIVPYRQVRIVSDPKRFEILGPARESWQVALTNTAGMPVSGTLEIGPLPAGVEMETVFEFSLAAEEEKEFEIPLRITDNLSHGRTVVPYVIWTEAGGKEADRRGFFAILTLDPGVIEDKKLLFYAPLDDDGPAQIARGRAESESERVSFVPGIRGKALGPETAGYLAYHARENVRGEAGTLSIWVKVVNNRNCKNLLSIPGPGSQFISLGIYPDSTSPSEFLVGGEPYPLPVNPTIDHWYHLAVTWNLEHVVGYVNGCRGEIQKRKKLDLPTGSGIFLGMHNLPAERIILRPTDCVIFDELRIYSAPLAEEEIKELYTNMAK